MTKVIRGKVSKNMTFFKGIIMWEIPIQKLEQLKTSTLDLVRCKADGRSRSRCDVFHWRSISGPHYVISNPWGPVNMEKAVSKGPGVLLYCAWKSLTILLNALGSY